MFRKLRRYKQKLPAEECISIIRNTRRGVMSVIGDCGYPYGMPLNHWYCEKDGKLYFHSAIQGHRRDSFERCNKVSYCMIDDGTPVEGAWDIRFRSVIIFGHIEIVEDKELALDICKKLNGRFAEYNDRLRNVLHLMGEDVLVYALVPEHISGKQITEK